MKKRKNYTINEVAIMYGKHRNTVVRWIQSGKLEATLIGDYYDISDEQLKRFEARKKGK